MKNQIQNTTVSSIENENGKYDAFFAIQDVTDLTRKINDYKNMKNKALIEIEERKKTEQELNKTINEKDIIYNEMHHRVKNNMTMIN